MAQSSLSSSFIPFYCPTDTLNSDSCKEELTIVPIPPADFPGSVSEAPGLATPASRPPESSLTPQTCPLLSNQLTIVADPFLRGSLQQPFSFPATIPIEDLISMLDLFTVAPTSLDLILPTPITYKPHST